MEIEDYAIKAMEALIRYGKMPMSNTKGVADTAWDVAKRMKELEQQVKFVDLAESRPLKCQCKNAKFTRTVDADFNPLCGKCGKVV